MAIDISTITEENVEIPANSEAAAPTEESSGVPAEVLELPIVRGLLEGSPPAIYNESGAKSEEINTVIKNGKSLKDIGIGFFHDPKAKLDLAYNTQFISPDMVKEAAKKGALKQIAESYTEVSARINAAVGAPAAGGAALVGGDMSLNLQDSQINTARVNNLSSGSPSSGAQPGAGRVLNDLLKPTI